MPSPALQGDGPRSSGAQMSFAERTWDALRLLGVLLTYMVSRRPVRPLADEASMALPGDELVADAKVQWKHAITIRARPAEIRPWLVQMGCRRAGWYSYDGLDNRVSVARTGSSRSFSRSRSATSSRWRQTPRACSLSG